jgi:HPt (histidine-containing phosphotransfer) domain-containing protein
MQEQFQHIDPASLLDAIGNDRATFSHLIGMFQRATPLARDRLLAAVAQDDRESASRVAHEMRGNVVIFGATTLAAELSRLEQALRDGPAPALQMERVQLQLDAVLGEMQAALALHGD